VLSTISSQQSSSRSSRSSLERCLTLRTQPSSWRIHCRISSSKLCYDRPARSVLACRTRRQRHVRLCVQVLRADVKHQSHLNTFRPKVVLNFSNNARAIAIYRRCYPRNLLRADRWSELTKRCWIRPQPELVHVKEVEVSFVSPTLHCYTCHECNFLSFLPLLLRHVMSCEFDWPGHRSL
jgi:hypothetical protein